MKKFMKRLLLVTITLVLVFAFNGCTHGNGETDTTGGTGGTGSTGGTGENLPVSTVLRDLEVVVPTLVGTSEAVIVKLPDGKNMLIDTGSNTSTSKDMLKAELNNLHITTIDYLVLTSTDITRIGGGKVIFENFNISKFYRPNISCNHINAPTDANLNSGATGGYVETNINYANMLAAAKMENCDVEIINKDSDISYRFTYNNVPYEYKVDFLTPTTSKAATSFSNSSDYSAMISIEYKGKKVLIASDATATTEATFNANYPTLDIDVLLVARHGDAASTTEAFLNIAKPEYAIITVASGVNNTGNWPNQAALDRLQSKNVTLYRTDRNSTIITKIASSGTISVNAGIPETDGNFIGRDAQ